MREFFDLCLESGTPSGKSCSAGDLAFFLERGEYSGRKTTNQLTNRKNPATTKQFSGKE